MCVPESQYNSDLISTTVRRLRRFGPLLFVPQLSQQIPAHTKAATLMHLRDCVSANAETLIIIMPGVKCATHSFVTFHPPILSHRSFPYGSLYLYMKSANVMAQFAWHI